MSLWEVDDILSLYLMPLSLVFTEPSSMDSSTICQAPPQAAYFLWSCDKVYHKQEVCLLLNFLGQIFSWQYNPNLLDKSWPCTVINDHDWQLWNCPLFELSLHLSSLSKSWYDPLHPMLPASELGLYTLLNGSKKVRSVGVRWRRVSSNPSLSPAT